MKNTQTSINEKDLAIAEELNNNKVYGTPSSENSNPIFKNRNIACYPYHFLLTVMS
jgi:hypothetical protein